MMQEPARLGAQLLDAKLPGWRELVEPATLDLSDCQACVLGQIFGDYERGLIALALGNDDALTFGFSRERGRWASLTAAWRRVLKRSG